MSLKKCVKQDIIAFEPYDIEKIGLNILHGKQGEIIDLETGKAPITKALITNDVNAILIATNQERIATHIDILCPKAQISFDLGKEISVEKIVISGFFNKTTNYTIGEFKLYSSNERSELFSKQNEIAHEISVKSWHTGERNNADWLYETKGKCRFFGLEILNSNPTDDVIRIRHIGLYSEEYTKQASYSYENLPENMLTGMEPKDVTDNLIYKKESLNVKGAHRFSFALKDKSPVTRAWVITNGMCRVSCNGINPKISPLDFGRFEYKFDFDIDNYSKNLEIEIMGDTQVELIGAYSGIRKASVCFSETVCNNFMGIGANVVPVSLMPHSVDLGYNEVYWELEKRRILLAKPNVVRVWFQPDWIVKSYENYKYGNFNFDTPEMYSVYKYLDTFKESGTEVLFNFGWKVASDIQEWFSFTETPKRQNSAPRELELFAKCCAATLRELIENRGYTNIKYLTFYNEPDYAFNAPDYGDFIVIGCDRKEYWEKMLKLCKQEVSANGIDVEFWGCELGGDIPTQLDWINYFEQRKLLDCHTIHRYRISSAGAKEYFNSMLKAGENTPVVLSECGQCYGLHQYSWDCNSVQLLCDVANSGISGAFLWVLNSVYLADPCSFAMRNEIDMWDIPSIPSAIDNVREVFYEWAMLTHYIPNHCKSVKTTVESGMRLCAFKTESDDYTVIVELDKSNSPRDISIKFDKLIGRKFYKHIYNRPCCRNGNATLPPVCGVMNVDNRICDKVSGDYQEIVYTTIPPIGQVVLPNVEVLLSPAQKYLPCASLIDCENAGDVAWEIIKTVGNECSFYIDKYNQNRIAATREAMTGDMCAVKVYSKINPKIYSIMIVKIK